MHNVWAIGRMLLLWCHSPVWKIPSSGDQLHTRDALPAYDRPASTDMLFELGMQSRVARLISQMLAF